MPARAKNMVINVETRNKGTLFSVTVSFTNGIEDRDIELILGASGSELRHGIFICS